ncbi:T9SS type A sorting domain-containing protein [bacterium]|nr:T9SS type A sorting domain-containing protein [bacterium]
MKILKYSLLVIGILFAACAFAQPQAQEYIYGSNTYDVLNAVTRLPDGSFILAGTSPPDGDSWQDVYLEKLNVGGTGTEWTVEFGGWPWDEPYDVIPALDGGYLVVGATRSGAGTTHEMFARRINPDGSPDWQHEYGAAGYDAARKVFAHDGGYTLFGYTRLEKFGRSDFRMLRIDTDGNELWHADYGGSEDEMCFGAGRAGDGSFLIAGYTHSWESQDQDLYMVHVNADGDMLHEFYEVADYPYVPRAVIGESDGFVIAGTMYAHPESEMPSAFLMKVDLDGNIVWRHDYTDGMYAEPRALTKTPYGYALAGFAYNGGQPDGWVRWTNSAGNAGTEWTVGGDGWEEFHAVALLGENDLLLVGLSTSTANRESDFYRVHVGDSLVASPERRTVVEEYRLADAWPNPFNSVTRLRFETNRAIALRIALYDLLGREVLTVAQGFVYAGAHSYLLTGSTLASGMYLVRAYANGTPVDQKRVVLVK